MVGRGRDRGALPRDLGLQLRAGRRCRRPILTLAEVAEALLPALAEVGTDMFHVVVFFPEDTTELLVELSTLGHTLSWDLVMDLTEDPSDPPADVRVEPLERRATSFGRASRTRSRCSATTRPLRTAAAVSRRRRSAGEHKRWLGVRDDNGTIAALAALVQLEGVGYLDNVATFPEARGRGMATAIVSRAVELAREAGAEHVSLFADPDALRGRPDVRTARLPGSGAARVHERARRGRRASRRMSRTVGWVGRTLDNLHRPDILTRQSVHPERGGWTGRIRG